MDQELGARIRRRLRRPSMRVEPTDPRGPVRCQQIQDRAGGCQSGRDRVERACEHDLARCDAVEELSATGHERNGKSAGHGLPIHCQVGLHPETLLRATRPQPKASDDLVEDEQDAVPVTKAAHFLQKAGLRWDRHRCSPSPVHHDRGDLDRHSGRALWTPAQGSFHSRTIGGCQSPEGPRTPRPGRTRRLPIPPRITRDIEQQGVVPAVIVASELDESLDDPSRPWRFGSARYSLRARRPEPDLLGTRNQCRPDDLRPAPRAHAVQRRGCRPRVASRHGLSTQSRAVAERTSDPDPSRSRSARVRRHPISGAPFADCRRRADPAAPASVRCCVTPPGVSCRARASSAAWRLMVDGRPGRHATSPSRGSPVAVMIVPSRPRSRCEMRSAAALDQRRSPRRVSGLIDLSRRGGDARWIR